VDSMTKTERDASACTKRHQDFALAPVTERERDAFACIRRHQGVALAPVGGFNEQTLFNLHHPTAVGMWASSSTWTGGVRSGYSSVLRVLNLGIVTSQEGP